MKSTVTHAVPAYIQSAPEPESGSGSESASASTPAPARHRRGAWGALRAARNVVSALVLACAATVLTPVSCAQNPEAEEVAPGAVYRDIIRAETPWAIQVLEVSRGAGSLRMGVVIGRETVLGIEPLDSIAHRLTQAGRKVVGGINGDFYVLAEGPFQGDPVGLCIAEGELVSTPIGRSALVFAADGTPSIGRFAFKGEVRGPDGASFRIRGVNQHCAADAVVLLTPRFNVETRPQEGGVAVLLGTLDAPLPSEGTLTFEVIEKRPADAALSIPPHRVLLIGRGNGAAFLETLQPGGAVTCSIATEPSTGAAVNAVGGGPRIIRDGALSIEASDEGISESFVSTRHPRTAFGYNDTTCFLVTVDGRREGHSAGMSLPELASLMLELGATEAVNLDGGGSTTMLVRGSIRNRPSDNRVRPIGNGILVYEGVR